MTSSPAPINLALQGVCSASSGECRQVVGGVTIIHNAQGLTGFLVDAIAFGRRNTVTLSSSLIISTGYVEPDSPLLAHEMGHIEQARLLGLLYLPIYVGEIPFAVFVGGLNAHTFHPFEIAANLRAGLNWDGTIPPGWTYPR